jgi:uncharacterized membrane protein YccF (DUF307 family)
MTAMRTIGNIIWILLGGVIIAALWAILGLVFFIPIVGIPLGRQCFKMASLTLTPFGSHVVYGGGAVSFVTNVLWAVLVGWWMWLCYAAAGLLNMCTIVGVPFGIQSFKMGKLAFCPFGAVVA